MTDGAPALNPGQQPPVPTPADLARAGQQQNPPAPVLPPAGPQALLDTATGLPMTQDRFTTIMTRENGKGRLKVLKELCEAAGVPFDHERTDVAQLTQVLKDAEEARKAQLSEDQRRTQDIEAREQAAADREARAAQREADAARRDRDSLLQSALIRLGAVDTDDEPNLQDALAMLQRDLAGAPDADAAAVTAAAENIKKRRPALFGTAAPQTLPPAPSGGPAGGGTPRPQTAGKDAVKEAARARARAMGLRNDDAA
ncbi:hypothetical protein PV382_23450 [Streptomyces scabiei]|uniref:hypothetical protein n=1 Tax=Streptomyces scabiei TaxID=1930 RepID=UPI0029A85D59|nr:hypothetical protein [Streptomyces scabiei]MDX2999500.1 hypothetical protein [Streptomyces scabiei]MDX3048698.1 hypothetical protein [Streptomyces scabiei]MDX3175209.1 hypothetical protein [Streptomyces scabiei]